MAYFRKEWKLPSGEIVWQKERPAGGRPTGRLRVQIALGRNPETGRTRWESKSFALRKDAERWAKSLEVKRDTGSYQPTVSTATLADYLRDTWLPFYATQVRSTYNAEKVLGKWILNRQPDTPYLGRIALRKLTPKNFTALYTALAEQGMRYRGIEQVHRLLHRALEHAVGQAELPSNPTHYAKLPRPDVKAEITCEEDEDVSEVECLTLDQAKRFREAALDDRWKALWLLLLDAGLRPGEALALQWRHIDWERSMVKVRGSLTRVRNEKRKEKGKGWIVTKPKTPSSIGDVPVRDETMKALKEWKREQAEQRLRIGPEWQDHGLVFTTENGSQMGNNMRRSWQQVMRKADGGRGDLGTWGPAPKKPRHGPTAERPFTPRYSPYVLRHTCATLLLLGGMDLLHVSRRLRHKNITITARFYGHVKAEHTTQAPAIWDRLFASAAGGSG